MFFAQFNKFQHPLGQNIVLKDMRRANHVCATFSQKPNFFDDVMLQFFIGSNR